MFLLDCSSVFTVFMDVYGLFGFFVHCFTIELSQSAIWTLSLGVEFETKEIKDAAHGGFLISLGVSMSFTGEQSIASERLPCWGKFSAENAVGVVEANLAIDEEFEQAWAMTVIHHDRETGDLCHGMLASPHQPKGAPWRRTRKRVVYN